MGNVRDPLVNRANNDRTIRTVFTHDHFALHGMTWAINPMVPGSRSAVMGVNPNAQQIATQGGLEASGSFNLIPPYGSGGRYAVPGDYLYRDHTGVSFAGGLWGIVRVIP